MSASTSPRRCSCCREWSGPDRRGLCRICQTPWVSRELEGLPKAGEVAVTDR